MRNLLDRFFRKRLPSHLVTGSWGEKQAEKLLKEKGLKILGRRVKVGPRGELDLIAKDGNTLVFIEVKTRRNSDFGRPIVAVDKAKRMNLSRAAVKYLKKIKSQPDHIRFDIIEVIGTPDKKEPPELRHIENAFPLEGSLRPWW